MYLIINSSNFIKYTLTNPELSPSNVDDATVEVTILDDNDAELVGESWPVELPYNTGSAGVYSKTFNPFVNLIEGVTYSIVIDVVGSDNLQDQCTSKAKAIKKICSLESCNLT